MPSMLAYCPTCKLLFEAPRLFGVTGPAAATITLQNVRMACPNGHEARLLDGTYQLFADSLRLISGPPFTREMFERVIMIVAESKESDSPRDIAKRAGDIDPRLGEIVKNVSGNATPKSGTLWKATAIAILTALAATKCSVHVNLDVNKLIDEMSKPQPTIEQMHLDKI